MAMVRRRTSLLWATAIVLALIAVGAGRASAASNYVCSGTTSAPGVVGTAGMSVTYDSVRIKGVCVGAPSGSVTIRGNLTVTAGAVFAANYPAMKSGAPEGDATYTIRGNVGVENGGLLVLGCSPEIGCMNTTSDKVAGDLLGDQPLGMLIHNATIGGAVVQNGGGGGFSCTPTGFFAVIGSPDYSAFETSVIRGGVTLSGIRSCWLGLASDHVGESVRVLDNQLADPDAIEIISNTIAGNLACRGNSMVWDSSDANPPHLYPRTPQPNTVRGERSGQCVLASPTTPGGKPGPGPF